MIPQNQQNTATPYLMSAGMKSGITADAVPSDMRNADRPNMNACALFPNPMS